MCRNENVYPDPEEFRPERYIDGISENGDPSNIIFGFGRRSRTQTHNLTTFVNCLLRLCPGQQLADSNIYLVASNIIANMDIGKARDEKGQEITPVVEYPSSMVRYVFV